MADDAPPLLPDFDAFLAYVSAMPNLETTDQIASGLFGGLIPAMHEACSRGDMAYVVKMLNDAVAWLLRELGPHEAIEVQGASGPEARDRQAWELSDAAVNKMHAEMRSALDHLAANNLSVKLKRLVEDHGHVFVSFVREGTWRGRISFKTPSDASATGYVYRMLRCSVPKSLVTREAIDAAIYDEMRSRLTALENRRHLFDAATKGEN